MFELFENLTNWLWGLPLLITILATGVYLTVRSGFFQFRHFGYIVKNMFSKERRQEGGDDGKSLTPFQAISIAIGGTAVSYTHLDVYKRQSLRLKITISPTPSSAAWISIAVAAPPAPTMVIFFPMASMLLSFSAAINPIPSVIWPVR